MEITGVLVVAEIVAVNAEEDVKALMHNNYM